MKRDYHRFRILIFLLLILTSLCPVYWQPDGRGNYYLLSLNLVWGNDENGDQEDPILDPPDHSPGTLSAALENTIHLGMHPLRGMISRLGHAPDSGLKTAILRC